MLHNLFRSASLLLLVNVTSAVASPPCTTGPGNYFHNCEGVYRYTSGPYSGDKYVGEFRDGKKYGQGTYPFTGLSQMLNCGKSKIYLKQLPTQLIRGRILNGISPI